MTDSSIDESEFFKERLRQQRETFDQHKRQEHQWFLLRLAMGIIACVILPAFFVVSAYIVLNSASYSSTVVNVAATALFVDLLGVLGSIWKIVLNPNFMTELAPMMSLDAKQFKGDVQVQAANNSLSNSELLILEARYGAGDIWENVTDNLKAIVQDNKLRLNITNSKLGIDPLPGEKKVLKVTYSYKGRTYSKVIAEDETLELPEVEN